MKKAILSLLLSALTVTTGVTVGIASVTQIIGSDEQPPDSSISITADGFNVTEVDGSELTNWSVKLKPAGKGTAQYGLSDAALIKKDARVCAKRVLVTNLSQEAKAVRLKVSYGMSEYELYKLIFLMPETEGAPIKSAVTLALYKDDYYHNYNLLLDSLAPGESHEFTLYVWLNGAAAASTNTVIGQTFDVSFEFVATAAVVPEQD